MPDTTPNPLPAAPPAEEKKSLFQKMGAGLPVALTAIATILAGMSTGELSRAMYWRSAAAQDQAKANDQWSLAGFKRDRSLMCETTADTLRAVGGYEKGPETKKTPTPELVETVGAWIRGKGEPPVDDKQVRAVLQAVHDHLGEPDVLKLAREVNPDRLRDLITAATEQANVMDQPFEAELTAAREAAKSGSKESRAAATAARYEVDARRYRAESTANQWVGFLLEVRVQCSTATSDRHRRRSENFFMAMLAAQVGGVGSSLALARKRKSVLWLVAGLAGLAALGFGTYVYLTM